MPRGIDPLVGALVTTRGDEVKRDKMILNFEFWIFDFGFSL